MKQVAQPQPLLFRGKERKSAYDFIRRMRPNRFQGRENSLKKCANVRRIDSRFNLYKM